VKTIFFFLTWLASKAAEAKIPVFFCLVFFFYARYARTLTQHRRAASQALFFFGVKGAMSERIFSSCTGTHTRTRFLLFFLLMMLWFFIAPFFCKCSAAMVEQASVVSVLLLLLIFVLCLRNFV
jgi:hypothetical protein